MRHEFEIDDEFEPKVDEQTAISEFKRMCHKNRIRQRSVMGDEAKSEAADSVIDAIMDGRLVIDDEGQPLLHWNGCTEDGNKPMLFRRFTGSAIAAIDRRKEQEKMAQTFSMLGSWTKTNIPTFHKMDQVDLSVALALFTLFFVK